MLQILSDILLDHEFTPHSPPLLGWVRLLNLVILGVSSIALSLRKTWISQVHSRLLSMKEDALIQEYFRYLANYKRLITVFNLTPWLALKLIAAS